MLQSALGGGASGGEMRCDVSMSAHSHTGKMATCVGVRDPKPACPDWLSSSKFLILDLTACTYEEGPAVHLLYLGYGVSGSANQKP